MRQTCIALLLGSCAHWHEPMRLPSKGGPPWVEYNTRHFRLQTDLDVEPARKLAIQMEQRRSGLISAAWHGATFEGPRTRVVAFRNSSELQTFLRRGVAGIWTLDTAGEKLMVLAASFTDQRADLAGYGIQVFTHELAHDLASSYFARQPRWLSEGMARCLETMILDEKHHKVIIGVPTRTAFRIESLPRLFRAEREGRGIDEDEAGGLVFYLENREGKAFNEYQKALYRGDDPDAAWASFFPAYATEDGQWVLQKKVSEYVKEVGYTQRGFNIGGAELIDYLGAVEERPMPEPELRALRGELWLTLQGDDEQRARGEVAEEARAALAQDPTLVRALELQLKLAETRADRLALATAAQQQRPEDFRAWMLTDEALGDDTALPAQEAERTRALEKAVQLGPDNSWALHRLARAYARAGRADEAFELGRKSLNIFPDSAYALDSLALVAKAWGDCGAAQRLQQMAVDRLPHLPPEFKATSKSTSEFLARCDAIRKRLDEYKTGCR